jgi:26S proteasome regulatory subunit N6
MVSTNTEKFAEAKKLSADQPAKAEAIYKEILSKPPGTNEAALKDYETALMALGELYRDHKYTA